ncbi:MAG: di-trans,poly-cis-decaprenylcistransferase [Acetobacteraceae bacterium]|nr:di-trans,poly-cis-decaprenylcistransferase [Acetobacteraceae bacterium]
MTAPLRAQPLDPGPHHVAIVMDGNGRWATARGLPRAEGHRRGAQAARRTVEAAAREGIRWLTLFGFSSENWGRPAEEVRDLMGLLRFYLRNEINQLAREGVALRVIGERSRFTPDIVALIEEAEAATSGGGRLTLSIALSYGGRAEIVAAARAAMRAGIRPEALDEATFAGFLSTAGQPDPDLLIRTSGEQRLSNFLLWQCAYSELHFTPVLWPDFDATHLAEAIAAYRGRDRRFGLRASS